MLASLSSAALQGVDAEIVHVEVNTGESGDPKLILVGLPDAAVKESDDRVTSAVANSGFAMPRSRTTINLAPGHLRKEGPFYDLPIALGVLVATGQITAPGLDDWMIAGELSLSGATRPVRGALALARLARRLGKKGVLLPPQSAAEAALVEGLAVHAVAPSTRPRVSSPAPSISPSPRPSPPPRPRMTLSATSPISRANTPCAAPSRSPSLAVTISL
jgi:magnesium chelatase family protein